MWRLYVARAPRGARAEQQSEQDRHPARQRNIGDVHIGFLQGEIGDRNARDIGDAGDRKIDLGAEDDEGQPDGDDARDGNLRQDVADIVERGEGGTCRGEEEGQEDKEGDEASHAETSTNSATKSLIGGS